MIKAKFERWEKRGNDVYGVFGMTKYYLHHCIPYKLLIPGEEYYLEDCRDVNKTVNYIANVTLVNPEPLMQLPSKVTYTGTLQHFHQNPTTLKWSVGLSLDGKDMVKEFPTINPELFRIGKRYRVTVTLGPTQYYDWELIDESNN